MNTSTVPTPGALVSDWGGLVHTIQHDCLDPDGVDGRIRDMFERLLQLEACTTSGQVYAFMRSAQSFTKEEADYLMSPLLDHLYRSSNVPFKGLRGKPPDVAFRSALLDSCVNGFEAAAMFWLQRWKRQPRYEQEVLAACRTGLIDVVAMLLDLEAQSADTLQAAIAAAAVGGHIRVIEILLARAGSAKMDLNAAALAAADDGHGDVVMLLLRAGADVRFADDQLLLAAVRNNHVRMAGQLLDAGANVHTKGDLCLQRAAFNGYVEMLKLLLQSGADVAAAGESALMLAAQAGRSSVIRALYERGADVNGTDNDTNVLDMACIHNRAENVEVLLALGANPNLISERVMPLIQSQERLSAIRHLVTAALKPASDA